MSNLVGKKEVEEYKTEAPARTSDFLNDVDKRLVNLAKAVITDDIYKMERLAQIKWDVNSSRAQKFFLQSPNYRAILDYALWAKIFGTSVAISYIVAKLGLTYPTVTKIVNEAEAEGYINVYNKGDASEKTAIACKAWLVMDYMKRYVSYRAEGWDAIRNDYDTNAFHKWFSDIKQNPKLSDKLQEQLDKKRAALAEIKE